MPFFSYESKFSQAMLKLCSTAWLNLLWFLCSLPIFTAGASTTAQTMDALTKLDLPAGVEIEIKL